MSSPDKLDPQEEQSSPLERFSMTIKIPGKRTRDTLGRLLFGNDEEENMDIIQSSIKESFRKIQESETVARNLPKEDFLADRTTIQEGEN